MNFLAFLQNPVDVNALSPPTSLTPFLTPMALTPMAVALTQGVTASGTRDPEALQKCVSCLAARGGHLGEFRRSPNKTTSSSNKTTSSSRPVHDASHPVREVARDWKTGELETAAPIVLEFFTDPKFDEQQRESCRTIGEALTFPLHSALYALYDLLAFSSSSSDDEKSDDEKLLSRVESLRVTRAAAGTRASRGESGEWEVVNSAGTGGTPGPRRPSLSDGASKRDGASNASGGDNPSASASASSASSSDPLLLLPLQNPSPSTGSIDSLFRTLEILLKLGLEVNERDFHGNTPLLVLAETAAMMLEVKTAEVKTAEVKTSARPLGRAVGDGAVGDVLRACAALLIENGARVDVPPVAAVRTAAAGVTAGVTIYPGMAGTVKVGDRDDVRELLGGTAAFQKASGSFSDALKTVPFRSLPNVKHMADSEKGSYSSSKGSATECKLCWSKFGMISNRKHLCVATKTWCCDDCSQKRYATESGESVRISDGAYNRGREEARFMDGRKRQQMAGLEARMLEGVEEKERKERELAAKRRQRMEAEESGEGSGGGGGGGGGGGSGNNDNGEDSNRNELFKNLMGMFGGDDEEEEKKEKKLGGGGGGGGVGQVKNTMAEARDRLNERGEKLADLGEKSEKLANQSKQFSDMAKMLNQQQKSSWF